MDFLEELVADATVRNPEFPELFAAAKRRRARLRALSRKRVALGISQEGVAAKMGTSLSVVARLESGEADLRLSTLERYAEAIGARFEWSVRATGVSPAGT
jgi:hypothetical protein